MLVDFADTAKVAAALEGIDVVLSAITFSAITEAQVPLAEAAKQAGVKLFLPSEYGEKTDTLEGGILLPKKLFQDTWVSGARRAFSSESRGQLMLLLGRNQKIALKANRDKAEPKFLPRR